MILFENLTSVASQQEKEPATTQLEDHKLQSSFRTCHTSISSLLEDKETDTDISDSSDSIGCNDDLSVTFSTVEIHEFDTVLGDNPACTVGPPIALSKRQVCKTRLVDLDKWEAHRKDHRRHDDELRLRGKERTERLLEKYSFMEILERQREMWRIRKSRSNSRKDLLRDKKKESILSAIVQFFSSL